MSWNMSCAGDAFAQVTISSSRSGWRYYVSKIVVFTTILGTYCCATIKHWHSIENTGHIAFANTNAWAVTVVTRKCGTKPYQFNHYHQTINSTRACLSGHCGSYGYNHSRAHNAFAKANDLRALWLLLCTSVAATKSFRKWLVHAVNCDG